MRSRLDDLERYFSKSCQSLSYEQPLWQSHTNTIHDLVLRSPLAREFAAQVESGQLPRQKSAEAVLSHICTDQGVTERDTSRKVGATFDRLTLHNPYQYVSGHRSYNSTSTTECSTPEHMRGEMSQQIDNLLCSSMICGGNDCSKTSSSSSLNLGSPMPHSFRGYTGQFDMFIPDSINFIKRSKRCHTFGSRHHANGLIRHTSFIRDPATEDGDFSSSSLDPTSALSAILHYAHEQSCRAVLQERLRTREESMYRRELHRECTIARLEGISVGSYRYFLGCQTVEDYIAAKVCACWDECWCNKICTRFGDIRCPCSESLKQVGEDC